MKLLIVDDQRDVREALAAMIKRSCYSFIETLQAANARQAAQLIALHKPSLLLLDIVMPGSGGFEVLEEARRCLPDCRAIMMTGYPEMSYTLQALQEQVAGFLVKPVTEAELTASLSRVLSEKQRQRVESQLRQEALAMLDLYLSHNDATLDFQQLRRDCGLDEITAPYLACFITDEADGGNAGFVGAIAERLYRHGMQAIVYPRAKGDAVMITGVEQADGEQLAWLQQQLWELIRARSIGGAVLPRHKGIKSTYLQAAFACGCAIRQGIQGHALLYGQIDVVDCLLQLYLPEILHEAGKADLLFREFLRHRCTPQEIAGGLNNLFDACLAKRLTAPEAESLSALRGALENRLPGMKRDSHPHEKVNGMLAYIHAHYAGQITLVDAANALNMNYTYASALFKRRTGRNFTEYLQDFRLEKAAYLLKSSNRYSYEVARKVGFSNDKYFYRLFKKRYGMTPYQYKENGEG